MSNKAAKKKESVEPKPKVAIAIHGFEMVDFDVYYNHMFTMAHYATLYDIFYLGLKGLQAAEARNRMVDKALEAKCDWVFFLDVDHFVPKNCLPILMENREQAMVSGLVCKRGHPYQQVFWLKKDGVYLKSTLPLDGSLYEVAVCAFGCTLINLRKLKKLTKPYFRDTCLPAADGTLQNIRSDVNLCNMFTEAGEKVWVDTRLLIGHRGSNKVIFPQNAGLYEKLDEVFKENIKLREGMKGSYYMPESI